MGRYDRTPHALLAYMPKVRQRTPDSDQESRTSGTNPNNERISKNMCTRGENEVLASERVKLAES
jgi:hypothetical protein